MTITYTKDKSGDGYLLRGDQAELVEGATVTVTLKSGSTKREKVGPRRAGPFDDGVVIHEKASGASRGKSPQNCPHCGLDVNAAPERSAPIGGDPDGRLPF